MMKKLKMILAVFVLCGVVMAQDAQTVDPKKPIDLTMKTGEVTTYETVPGRSLNEWQYYQLSDSERQYVTITEKQVTGFFGTTHTEKEYYLNEHQIAHTTTQKVATTHDYLNVKEDGTLGKSGLTYTVTASTDYNNGKPYNGYVRQTAQGYFTVTSDVPANKVVAVQFLGAEMEDGSGNQTHQANNKIADYGIYLYDTETGKKTGDYLSVKDFNNYFDESAGITAGKSFGVWYKDNNGNIIASTGEGMERPYAWGYGYYGKAEEAENGMLGNFDYNSHELRVYDTNGKLTTPTTDKHFMCLSAGEYGKDSFQTVHWEFMLQTTIDDPYFPVNPNEFGGGVVIDDPVINGNDMSGQPLPGTLATILISSLCAGALRKRNKK